MKTIREQHSSESAYAEVWLRRMITEELLTSNMERFENKRNWWQFEGAIRCRRSHEAAAAAANLEIVVLFIGELLSELKFLQLALALLFACLARLIFLVCRIAQRLHTAPHV